MTMTERPQKHKKVSEMTDDERKAEAKKRGFSLRT
jgi:hypothetical protein